MAFTSWAPSRAICPDDMDDRRNGGMGGPAWLAAGAGDLLESNAEPMAERLPMPRCTSRERGAADRARWTDWLERGAGRSPGPLQSVIRWITSMEPDMALLTL